MQSVFRFVKDNPALKPNLEGDIIRCFSRNFVVISRSTILDDFDITDVGLHFVMLHLTPLLKIRVTWPLLNVSGKNKRLLFIS